MSQKFAILGLGYFGVTVAEELRRRKNEVLGVDIDEARVNTFSSLLSHGVIADITDANSLAELSLEDYDAVIIDADENLEASMVCTLLAREHGAVNIWVKAYSDMHYRLLDHLGADHIIYPEHDSGMRVAESLHYHALMDFINLGDHKFVVDLQATEKLCEACETVGSLELDKLDLSLVALKRGPDLMERPGDTTALQVDDHIVLLGELDALRDLGKKL